MREDHRPDESDAPRDQRRDLERSCLRDRDGGERWTENIGAGAETDVQPVGNDRLDDEAAAQSIEREESGQRGQRLEAGPAQDRTGRSAFCSGRNEQWQGRGGEARDREDDEEGLKALRCAREYGRESTCRGREPSGQRVVAKCRRLSIVR